MAWLRLTDADGRETLVNSNQISEFTACNGGNTTVWRPSYSTDVRESVEQIAAMIVQTERAERLDGIFNAIVYNFPQGYDPTEIVETARRLLDALDKSRES